LSEDKLEPNPPDNSISDALKHAEKVVREQEKQKEEFARIQAERRKALVAMMKEAEEVVNEAAPLADAGIKYLLMMVALQELSRPVMMPMPPGLEETLKGIVPKIAQIAIEPLQAKTDAAPVPFKVKSLRNRIKYAWDILTKGTLEERPRKWKLKNKTSET